MLSGPVTSESIIDLLQSSQICVEYYKYRRLRYLIDSPGGEVAGLRLMLDQMRDWIDDGGVIETVGLTSAASAAALILSHGSHGCRSVMPSTSLLYHDTFVSEAMRVTVAVAAK